jgi:hypothetical protein
LFGYFRTKTKTQPTDFGLVSVWLFYIKNQKLYCFFGFFFVISNGLDFSLTRFFQFSFFINFGSVFQFQAYEIEPIGFFNILIGLIGFFSWFGVWVFFPGFLGFFAHPYSFGNTESSSFRTKRTPRILEL